MTAVEIVADEVSPNAQVKVKRQPEVIWDSNTRKTYVKAKHGSIGTVYKTGTQKRAEAHLKAV